MKYCVIKNTTQVIDGSDNHILTMRDNAKNAGFTVDEIEILTEEEYLARKELEPKPIKVNEIEELKQALAELTILISIGGM